MAFGDHGSLYVASRNTKEILRYNAKDGRPSSKPFIKDLADNPEFLMLVGWTLFPRSNATLQNMEVVTRSVYECSELICYYLLLSDIIVTC